MTTHRPMLLVLLAFAAVALAGCGTTDNTDDGYAVDPDSDLVATWRFASAFIDQVPVSLPNRFLIINADGTWELSDNQDTLQRGSWGVKDNRVRFTADQASPDAIWSGTFTPRWTVTGDVLQLVGNDGAGSYHVHAYQRQAL
ncbi:MAG TPA: hypothetical protein PLD23_12695 [Armatimonadota bacterium]|nr:hypothetical protein [Armatimonadota bacterium]HQK94362.1 hypothetical protein [Armatimonadota bacterium]